MRKGARHVSALTGKEASLVGFALAQTMHHANDFELWVQQAMARVGLRTMPPEIRRTANDRAFSAYEEMDRVMGHPVRPRPADWADR